MTTGPDEERAEQGNEPTPQAALGRDRAALITSVVLMCLAFALLPVWDGMSRFNMLSALSGSGLGASRPVPVPISVAAYPIAAIALGWSIVRKATVSPRWARALYFIGAALAIVYAVTTGVETAVTRSQAVDSWVLCETGQHPGGGTAFVSRFKRKPMFDGPHLDNGDPCTLESENRYEHRKQHPDGNVSDGVVQIWKRFPKDRARVIGGTSFVFAAVVLGALMLRRGIRN